MISDIEKIKLEAFKITEAERILQYDFIEDPSLPAIMGLSSDYEILYNKKLFDKIEDDRMKKFVLIHEFLHDILDHHPRMINLLGENVSSDDVYIFNIAADHIVNTIIYKLSLTLNLTLPSELTKHWVRFEKLDDKITVEGLYRKLKKSSKVTIKSYSSNSYYSNSNKNKDKQSNQSNSKQQEDNNASESIPQQKQIADGNDGGNIKEVTLSIEYNGNVYENKKIIVTDPSKLNDKKLSRKYGIGSSKADWVNKFASKVGSSIFSNEIEFTKIPLNLKKSFNDLLTIIKSGSDDISFKKRSKLNDIVNSKVLLPSFVSRTVDVGIGIDVSGSISDSEYSDFISVIKSNIQLFSPNSEIVSFDTNITNVIKIREVYNSVDKLKTRVGYGGTDFSEVFDRFKNKELVVVFTDLFPYRWPDKKPYGKLFFIAKLMNKVEVPYGKVIYF